MQAGSAGGIVTVIISAPLIKIFHESPVLNKLLKSIKNPSKSSRNKKEREGEGSYQPRP